MSRRPTRVIPAAALMTLASFALAPSASAATDPTPFTMRVASPADDLAHPGSKTEWWYFNIANPATGEVFIAQIGSAPIATTSTFWYDRNGNKKSSIGVPTTPVIARPGPHVCSSAGCLKYDPVRKAYHLVYTGNGYSADLWFDDILPGVTNGPRVYDGQDQSWTNPVATSKVTGWLRPVGRLDRINVAGWRGYHDHNWGNFDLTDQRYTGWEWAGSHEPDGTAKVMGGVTNGAGEYYGALVRATPQGTTFCASNSVDDATAVTLSNFTSISGFRYPLKVDTHCTDGGTVAPQEYKVTSPHLVKFINPLKAFENSFDFTESVGVTVPGSIALIEHFRTLSHFGS